LLWCTAETYWARPEVCGWRPLTRSQRECWAGGLMPISMLIFAMDDMEMGALVRDV
jgi:hypothetical protein